MIQIHLFGAHTHTQCIFIDRVCFDGVLHGLHNLSPPLGFLIFEAESKGLPLQVQLCLRCIIHQSETVVVPEALFFCLTTISRCSFRCYNTYQGT